MKAIIVRLECITNMHVGNGDVNYNIIDNEVERDPVTGYPTINASGVKGALREYFMHKLPEKVNDMFGSDSQGNSTQGKLKIFGADMIAMPARASKGKNAYYLVSSSTALANLQEKFMIFLNRAENIAPAESKESCAVEGLNLVACQNVFEKEIYMMEDDQFQKLALPVVARNKLDNGISKNLWYEEIVPHKSLFFFPVVANTNDAALLDEFAKTVHGNVVQFGGNASIGYGFCKVTVMEA